MRKAVFAPLLLIPALGGCINLGLGNAKTPPALLTLTATSAPVDGSTTSGPAGTALSVMEPETAAKLAVLRVPVTIDAARVAYLRNAQWVERPARLFQHLLAETLRARGNRLVVEGDAASHGPILSGRLIDFGYDAHSRAAIVRFDATRQLPDGTTQTRRFEAEIDHLDADVAKVGPALNQAANQVAHAVAEWMA
ncbi:ABC-type transport auxiliary lipoprotein family protein [Novosphingobium sp. Fuku2-ISO-50]|uniref:ABC-type transport auxiliary lipoprotein family protein n=1 Tax=Novosphingobium sp. Fuku2-ISO-50 TaxID=1739114 RepID=UPI000A671215|nr:ABC-type transport auxiliary lipoprotein family protein [Novosphingobium sp. Fuku2-ISO-50]